MSLDEYHRKRKKTSPEPRGEGQIPAEQGLFFCVHKHAATRLHYDLRLEFNGTLKSWAIPKGPSLNPLDVRLAVFVEDHPLDYGRFEGLIPAGHYGAGATLIWDSGIYTARIIADREKMQLALQQGLDKGHITFILHGQKLKGEFALIRTKDTKNWLLTKKRDQFASYEDDVLEKNRSVTSGLTIEELEAQNGPFLENDRIHPRNLDWIYDPQEIDLVNKTKKQVSTIKSPMRTSSLPPQTILRENEWIYSTDYQGFRVLIEKRSQRVTILGKDPTHLGKTFKEALNLFSSVEFSGVFDASILVKNEQGIYDRKSLLAYAQEKRGKVEILIEDVLVLDDKDLTMLGFAERQEVLSNLKANKISTFKTAEEAKIATEALGLTKIKAHHVAGIYRTGKVSSALLSLNVDAVHLDSSSLISSAQRVGDILDLSDSSHKDPHHPSPIEPWDPIAKSDSTEIIATLSQNFVIENKSRTKIKIKDGPILTHLDKILWPKSGLTKGDLISYYASVAKIMVPYLKDRPISMNRHLHGIEGKGFYQKDLSGYHPPWFQSVMVPSSHRGSSINFALCQDERSLLYLANLCCIEIHCWLSRQDALDSPDYFVIDIDPDDRNTFEQVIEVAQATHHVLQQIKAEGFVKTSGATGMHIYIPLARKYDYERVRQTAEEIAKMVHDLLPTFTSITRNKGQRHGKIYIDYMQNVRGQTLAAPYSLRPVEKATVSAPLKWEEVRMGLKPDHFHIQSMKERLVSVGDLWKDLNQSAQLLEMLEQNIEKLKN